MKQLCLNKFAAWKVFIYFLTPISIIHPSGQADQGDICSSVHLPQSLQIQRRNTSVRHLKVPPIQLFLSVQLHSASFASLRHGLPALLGMCSLPRSAQPRAGASCVGPGLVSRPARRWRVCDQHRNGPFWVHLPGRGEAEAS